MKKTFAVILSLVLLLSVCGTVFADSGETNQTPEFEKPVTVSVTDETGAPVSGATLQLSDSEGNVLKTWDANGDRTFFLKEGEYAIRNLSVSDDYLEDTEPVFITVERTEAEQTVYTGTVQYDHDHTAICNRSKHVGLELYTVSGNGESTVAYCFNHGKKNPTGSDYREYIATPDLLFRYALNKNDEITARELYDHVLSIIYRSASVQRAYDLDDVEIRYLAYMAIKNFTDPKCFIEFDENGSSLLLYDENGKPMKDEDGKYLFAEGGCVLGTIVHHGNTDHKSDPDYVFPQKYVDAFKDLIGSTAHPSDYYLYFYYPEGYEIGNDQSFQILLSAKRAAAENAVLTLRPALQFEVTLVWAFDGSIAKSLPSVAKVAPHLRLYADGEDVTDLYEGKLEVIDNRNKTYTVRFSGLPKLNEDMSEIEYTLEIGGVKDYIAEENTASNGGTIVLTGLNLTIKPLKPVPIKPVRP